MSRPPPHERAAIGFAHRGSPAWYQRENTLGAFRRALARGVRGLESDVWLTADGVPVLHHDGVFGPPGRRRRIADEPEGRLPRWVPTLASLYAAGGDRAELSLDVKVAPEGHREAVRRIGAAARVAGPRAVARLWLCGDIAALRAWRSEDDTIALVNSAAPRDVDGPARLERRLRELVDLGAAALNLRASVWARWMVPRVHEHGLLAFGWDAQPRATIRQLLGYGLDGVYSDHLTRLVQLTGTAGSERP